MPKQKIVLRRRVTPQTVRLPNGQSFVARYKRVSRRNLPRKVIVRWTRQTGPQNRRVRKKQTGGNILGTIAKLGTKLGTKPLTCTDLLRKRLDVGVKAINSEVGKKLVNKRIKHAPELYRLGTSKIKNKNVKRALESEVSNYMVKEAQKKEAGNVENLFG